MSEVMLRHSVLTVKGGKTGPTGRGIPFDSGERRGVSPPVAGPTLTVGEADAAPLAAANIDRHIHGGAAFFISWLKTRSPADAGERRP
jgi:hypothetical protein